MEFGMLQSQGMKGSEQKLHLDYCKGLQINLNLEVLY
jgi:hypothetical protein